MSKNNPLRGEHPLPDLPTLIPGPLADRPLTLPGEPVAVWVSLHWTDGYTEAGEGYAKGWTTEVVLVDVYTSRGHYYTCVSPVQVSRRVPMGTPNTES